MLPESLPLPQPCAQWSLTPIPTGPKRATGRTVTPLFAATVLAGQLKAFEVYIHGEYLPRYRT